MKTRIFAIGMAIVMFFKGNTAYGEDSPAHTVAPATRENFLDKSVRALSERQKILALLKDSSMERMITLSAAQSEKITIKIKWFASRVDDMPVEVISGMVPITTSQEPIFIDFKIASDGDRIIGIALFVAFDEKKEFVVPVIIQTFGENEAYDDEQYAQQRKLLGILHPRIEKVISHIAQNSDAIMQEALAALGIATDRELAQLAPSLPERKLET